MLKFYSVCFFTLFLLCRSIVSSAQNLVPNPSFEDLRSCPTGLDMFYNVNDWFVFGNSPDVFSNCSPTGTNVPNNQFGFQNAHSGSCYSGFITYSLPNLNYREFIGVRLNQTLTPGERYYISFYCCWSGSNQGWASNNIGCNLTTSLYSASNPMPIQNFAVLNIDTVLEDSLNWIKCSGSFIADSAYEYLVLGNFFSDTLTSIFQVNSNVRAYYYIDDVCLTNDSLYNEQWVDLQSIDHAPFTFKKIDNRIFLIQSDNKTIINICDLIGGNIRYDLVKIDAFNSLIVLNDEFSGVFIVNIKSSDFNKSYKIYLP